MPKSNIVKYTVEFDALEELSDDFIKRIIYEFLRSEVISVTRGGLTKRAADGLVRCPNCGALLVPELFAVHACAERPHR